jgi:hypothetical protein
MSEATCGKLLHRLLPDIASLIQATEFGNYELRRPGEPSAARGASTSFTMLACVLA